MYIYTEGISAWRVILVLSEDLYNILLNVVRHRFHKTQFKLWCDDDEVCWSPSVIGDVCYKRVS